MARQWYSQELKDKIVARLLSKELAVAEAAEQWVLGFVEHYNEHHRHRGIRMVMSGQRYREENEEVLRRRYATMAEARRYHPERWISGPVTNCSPVGKVWLK